MRLPSLPTRLRTLFVWSARAVALVLALGFSYQAIGLSRDGARHPAPGRLIGVEEGLRLHVDCQGGGAPTIVLQAGAGLFSSGWQWVQDELASTHRVCSYDRSGLGWSELVTGPHDGQSIVRRLRELLAAAGEDTSFVLVGHSLGGVLARLHYRDYPGDLLGLVLIEPGNPEALLDEIGRPRGRPITPCGWECPVGRLLTAVGVTRLAVSMLDLLNDERYPEPGASEVRAFYSTSRAILQAVYSGKYLVDLLYEGADVASLGETPTAVIYGTRSCELLCSFDSEEDRRAWTEEAVESWEKTLNLSARPMGLHPIDGANHVSIIAYRAHASRVAEIVRDVAAARPVSTRGGGA